MLKQITPPNLLQDQNIKALIEAIEPEFKKVKQQIINILIYPRIDELDEEILDLLAYQFHIEGYDLATTIEEKRNLIKRSIELHRYKGTKYAILEVFKVLNLEGQVKEWFEYSGQPYRFKVQTTIKTKINKKIDKTYYEKLKKLINQYKNERSLLNGFFVGFETTQNIHTSQALTISPILKKTATVSKTQKQNIHINPTSTLKTKIQKTATVNKAAKQNLYINPTNTLKVKIQKTNTYTKHYKTTNQIQGVVVIWKV